MTVTAAVYADEANTSINATIDGADLSVPAVLGNRHYQQILDEAFPIDPYPNVLADRIQTKVAELKQEFLTRSSADGITIDLDTAIGFQNAFEPISPATAGSTRFFNNIAAAVAARIVIEAIVDVPTAEAYDVVATPAWSA